MNNEVLNGKTVLITGASSGIGLAVALKLAKFSTRLCLVGRNRKNLREVSEKALKLGAGKVFIYRIDLEKEKDIKSLKAKVKDIDILIHNAGVISLGNLEEASVKDLDWHYRVNLRAPYLLTQIFLPVVKKKQGQIVFINSSTGIKAKAGVGQYSATKYALKAVADSLRDEVSEYGVKVISVFPGTTATPMQRGIAFVQGREYHPEFLLQPEDVADVIVNALSLPATAEVTDIMIRPFIKT